jgi:hypothetical protein
LNAAIDDFRIYSRAMSAEEIANFATPLTAPQGLAATGGTQEIQLSWDAVPNAASYTLKSSVSTGGPYTPLASGLAANAFSHSGLPIGTTRYYVVSADNAAGASPDSMEASATTESAPITDDEIRATTLSFSGLTASGGNLTVDIAASVVGHSYQVQRSADLSEGSWESVGAPLAGNGGALQVVLPVELGGRAFYRVSITR